MLTTINISLNVPSAYQVETLTQQLTDYANWLIFSNNQQKTSNKHHRKKCLKSVERRPSQSFLSGLVIREDMSSEQLIDEYLEEKYGV